MLRALSSGLTLAVCANAVAANPGPRLVGMPADAPDVLLGIADRAAVYVEMTEYQLPTFAGTTKVVGCTVHVAAASNVELTWTLDPGTVIDGVAHPRWRADKGSEDPRLDGWRTVLRKLTLATPSCDAAIAALRAGIAFKPPRRIKGSTGLPLAERSQDLGRSPTAYVGPYPRSLLISTRHDERPWHWRVITVSE